MEFNLPQQENLSTIQKSNTKNGRGQTFLDQLQASWLSVLTLIVLVVYGYISQTQIKNINDKISISNQDTVNVPVTVNGNQDADKESVPEEGKTLGDNTDFNPTEWIIDNFDIDSDGFYCTRVKKFEFWSIWSMKKYSPTPTSIKVKILTKSKQGSKNPPTLAISYGEYKTNFSPLQFYRLNIFDTDTKTIRLYDSDNKSVAQGWLPKEPDLASEMLIKLFPRNSNPNSRVINLNPELEYVVFGEPNQKPYTPEEVFEVGLPTVGIESGTVQKQIGIGSSIDTCFKPISIEIQQ